MRFLPLLLVLTLMAPKSPFDALRQQVAELEAFSKANFDTLAREMRAQGQRLERQTTRDRVDMLAPGSLHAFSGPHRAGRGGPPPDLGQPLVARLRDDPMIASGQITERVDSIASGNVLADPLFEAVSATAAVTIGTVNTTLGPWWLCKYVHNSGTNPSVRQYSKAWERDDQPGRSMGASALGLLVNWAAGGSGGDESFYLYPPGPGASDIFYNVAASASLPWVVASVMLIPTAMDADLSSVTARMEIIDAVTFAVIEASETAEMVGLTSGQRVPLAVATDASVSPAGGSGWTWRLRVDYVRTAAGAVTGSDLRVEDPSFSRSYTETPPSSMPIVGHWYPPQLMEAVFVKDNLVAGITTDLNMSDNAMGIGRYTIRGYWAIAGLSARLSANKTAGTLTIRGIVNGAYQSGDPSIAFGNAVSDQASGLLLKPDQVNFITADQQSTLGVEAVASAGFLPDATAELVVHLWYWLYQA